jgi:hypothetical protein
VCRCEVVPREALDAAVDATDDINVVKAYTRAGMGPCQGKNCQRHIAAMIGRRHGRELADVPLATPRMPLRPVPIAAMADQAIESPGLFLADDEAELATSRASQATDEPRPATGQANRTTDEPGAVTGLTSQADMTPDEVSS